MEDLDASGRYGFVALIFALVAQQISAERRERALKDRLNQSHQIKCAQGEINRLITDLGIDILKNPSEVELLRGVGPAAPTGVKLGPEFALRAACVLLDYRNFGNASSFDDPVSEIGLRIKSGSSSLDVLISLEGSSPGSPHQDIWIEIHDANGKRVHFAGPHCLSDPSFQLLAEELLKK